MVLNKEQASLGLSCESGTHVHLTNKTNSSSGTAPFSMNDHI